MNCVVYGRQRDERIISLIERGNAFTRTQIQKIFFSAHKDGQRKSQLRLAQLVKAERIKKFVRGPHESIIYYVKKPKYLDHALMINDVYAALVTQKPSYYSLDVRWSYSVLDNTVITDLLLILYTLPDKKGKKVFFIEVERSPSKRFDKPEKYLSVYKKNWVREEWATLVNDGKNVLFPNIIIVTNEPLTIKSDLYFIVTSPEEIQKDVYSVLRR